MALLAPRIATAEGRAKPRTRYGRPRRIDHTNERRELYHTNELVGSHAPLETEIHWAWRNPLRVLAVLMAILVVLTAIGFVLS